MEVDQSTIKLLLILSKKLPRKNQIKIVIDSMSQELEKNRGKIKIEDFDDQPENDMVGSEISNQKATLNLQQFGAQPMIKKLLQICVELQKQKPNLGAKIFELGVFLLINSTHDQFDLKLIEQAIGESYKKKSSAMINLYELIQPACFEQMLFARAMFLHHAIIYQIQNCKNDVSLCDITPLIQLQLRLLYTKKELDYVFYEEGSVSDYSKKDLNQFHDLIKQGWKINFESEIVEPKSKPISSQKVETSIKNLVLDNLCIQLRYIFDQKFVKCIDQPIEYKFFQAIQEELEIISKNTGLTLQICGSIIDVLQKIWEQIQVLKDQSFIQFSLVVINKMAQLSLGLNIIDLYKKSLILLTKMNLEIINVISLRDPYYQIVKSFIFKTITGEQKLNFKNEAVQFLADILTEAPESHQSSDRINLYFTLFDKAGIAPFIQEVFKFIIDILKYVPIDRSNAIEKQDYSINLSQIISNQLNCVDDRSQVRKQVVQLRSQTELIMFLLLKIMRCWSFDSKLQGIKDEALQKQFDFFGACECFNGCENPIKGFRIFQALGFVANNPTDIIKFLIENQQNLNKGLIGEMLGGNKEENNILLTAYAKYIFTSEKHRIQMDNLAVQYLSSLRLFLLFFRMPGESQQIDRILKQFAKVFSENSRMDVESAYILSYATMMLNTDIHNVNNKNKMDKPQFIANTKRADKHNFFDDQFLSTLFDEIFHYPFTLDEVEEARALGLYGEVGLFSYLQDRNQTNMLKMFNINTNIIEIVESISMQETASPISLNKKVSEQNLQQYALTSEQLLQHLSPSIIKHDRKQNIEQKQDLEDNSLKSNEIVSELQQSEVYQVKNGVQIEVKDILQVDQLKEKYQVKNTFPFIIRYFYNKIFQAMYLYLENTTLKTPRFLLLQELLFLLYDCAKLCDEKKYRSQIIYIQSVNAHLAFQQFSPFSATLLKRLRVKNSLMLEDQDYNPEDMAAMQRNISEDMKCGLMLISVIDGNIDQQTLELYLAAYIIALTIVQYYYNIKNPKEDLNQFQISEPLNKEQYALILNYEFFIQQFSEKFLSFQSTLDKVQKGYDIKSGEVLILLPPLKVYSALLNLTDYFLVDCEKLNTINNTINRLNSSMQFGIIPMIQKIIREFYSYISEFNDVTEEFPIANQGLFVTRRYANYNTDVRMYCKYTLLQDPSKESMFKLCTYILDNFLMKIGSFIIYNKYYTNHMHYCVQLINQVKGFISKYVSTIESKHTLNDYLPHILLSLSHLAKGITNPEVLIKLNEIVVDKISQANNDFLHIQHIMPYIIAVLNRVLLSHQNHPDGMLSSQFSCKACDHINCGISLQLPYEPLVQLKAKTQMAPMTQVEKQQNMQCYNQILTILSAVANKIDLLVSTNINQFFKYIVNIIISFQEPGLIKTCLAISEKIIVRMFELDIWDLYDALETLSKEIIEANLINKNNNPEVLNSSMSTFITTYIRLMQECNGFWSQFNNKQEITHQLYSKRVKNLIQLQRKDKQYEVLKSICSALLQIFDGNHQPSKDAALFILDELLLILQEFLSIKIPSMETFAQLIQECVHPLFSIVSSGIEDCIGNTQKLSERLIMFNRNILSQFISQDDLCADEGGVVHSIFGSAQQLTISKELYLFTYLSNLIKIVEKTTLSADTILRICKDIQWIGVELYQKAKTQKLQDINLLVLIMEIMFNLGMRGVFTNTIFGIPNFFNTLGFDIMVTVIELIQQCKEHTTNEYLASVGSIISDLKKVITAWQNDVFKTQKLFQILLEFIDFNNIGIRQQLKELLILFQPMINKK